MKKAVFLDRDGVINPHCGLDKFNNPESPLTYSDFQIFPFVGPFIQNMNEMGYLVIVVTNQPAVAKGKLKLSDLEKMNAQLMIEVEKHGGRIEEIYFCLHHPDPDQVVILDLLQECDCRKPKPGMLQKAMNRFEIDAKSSWMVGDSWKDVIAGKQAGCRTILISPTKENLLKCSPNYTAKNLSETVKIIQKEDH